MKGLDWFRVMTDIAWDGDLEHATDAEFRTLFELIAMSAYHLTDGVLMQRDCVKHLNTRRPADTLRALSAHGYITLEADRVTIKNYTKYQQTRDEVEAERSKNRDRVRRYRAITNAAVPEQRERESKSKSKKEEEKAAPNPSVENLITLASTVASSKVKWEPKATDHIMFAALLERFPEPQVRSELLKFKAYAPQKDWTSLAKAFTNWMNRCTPEPRPAAHVAFDEAKFSTEGCVPMPEELRGVFEKFGAMP